MSILLHITPGSWGLPSISPSCLSAIIFLQLTIPGKFTIVECTTPDTSPTGQLPYLTHDHHVVAPLSSIVTYISTLDRLQPNEYTDTNSDQGLSQLEASQRTAWFAHAEAHLGDLFYYTFYSVPSNWTNLTYPTLSSMFPIPQRYFVPARIREMHRPRLEAAGLWSTPEFETEAKKPFQPVSRQAERATNTNVFLQAFEKEKVAEKAKSVLDIYSRLLKDAYFSNRDRPSALDAVVAAHILLLLEPPYPAPAIKQLLLDSYPSLVGHARLLFSQTLDVSAPTISRGPSQIFTWRDIFPLMPWSSKRPAKTTDEIQFDRFRWSFFGLAIGSMVTYLAIVGRNVKIRIVRASDIPEEEEEDGEGEEEA